MQAKRVDSFPSHKQILFALKTVIDILSLKIANLVIPTVDFAFLNLVVKVLRKNE